MIETKVIAGGVGAGAGSVIADAVNWGLGVTFWGQPRDAASAQQAIDAVPYPLSALLLFVLTSALAVISAYKAPHTLRPDLHRKPETVGVSEDTPPV